MKRQSHSAWGWSGPVRAGIFLATLLPFQAVLGQSVALVEPWSNVFGGQEAVFHVRAPGTGSLPWRLSAGDATIQRGEISGDGAELRLAIPYVKEGVVFPMILTVGASVRQELWVFPENPFAGREQWLEGLGIQLFDPVGTTRDLFDELEVPYTDWSNLDALVDQQTGMVVVGEGLSFDDHPALMDILCGVARRLPVLCLSPEGGEFSVPGTEGADLPRPEALRLEGLPIVTALDKHIDAGGWPPDGQMPVQWMRMEAGRHGVVAVVGDNECQWAWLEADYSGRRARLVVCGIDLIEPWPEGPAPRFLFLRILEWMNPKLEDER